MCRRSASDLFSRQRDSIAFNKFDQASCRLGLGLLPNASPGLARRFFIELPHKLPFARSLS